MAKINLDDIFLFKTKEQHPIDIVFTFVDPTDQTWQQKYMTYNPNKKIDTTRFDFDNSQIIFALKTIEKYMNWINKIYIVQDNQRFSVESKFLQEKIVWVDHTEIIPKRILPTFNSMTIESFLWNIPNISDHFLYLNDDMFCGNYVYYEDFFDTVSGLPVQFYSKCRYYPHPWIQNIKQSNELFAQHYPSHQHICPQHAPYFILSKIMKLTYDKFRFYLEIMYANDKIRTYKNYAHNLIYLYAMYANYHKYVVNKSILFSPIKTLSNDNIQKYMDSELRKKFYCFYIPPRSQEQKTLYTQLQKIVLDD